MRRKVYEFRTSEEVGQAFRITGHLFDFLVDQLYDDILILTPHHRYLISLDDILDYGTGSGSGEDEYRSVRKSFILPV